MMPRCQDCLYWGRHADSYNTRYTAGVCSRVVDTAVTEDAAWLVLHADYGASVELVTREDFGCVQFEAKP